jgi:hypothetical protein
MGALTHAQLVTESLEMAGNTGLTTRAQTWLGLVLRYLFGKFDFPVQIGNAQPVVMSLAAGTATLTLPTVAGSPVTYAMKRVMVTPSGSRDWRDIGIFEQSSLPPGNVPDDIDSTYKATLPSRVGRPSSVFVKAAQDGLQLAFSPVPDGAYFVLLVAEGFTLSTVTSYSAASVNMYPDDLTVMQGVTAMALKHMNDERAPAEWQLFEKMAGQDRVRYGMMNGANSPVGLNPRHFRGGGNTGGGGTPPWSTGWMGPV